MYVSTRHYAWFFPQPWVASFYTNASQYAVGYLGGPSADLLGSLSVQLTLLWYFVLSLPAARLSALLPHLKQPTGPHPSPPSLDGQPWGSLLFMVAEGSQSFVIWLLAS